MCVCVNVLHTHAFYICGHASHACDVYYICGICTCLIFVKIRHNNHVCHICEHATCACMLYLLTCFKCVFTGVIVFQSGTCVLREAIIIASVLLKNSILCVSFSLVRVFCARRSSSRASSSRTRSRCFTRRRPS